MFSPNNLAPTPSRILCALLGIPHAAALSLVMSSNAPTPLLWAAGFSILASAGYNSVRHGLLGHPRSVLQLHFDTHRLPGACELRLMNGHRLTADILADSVVTASFVLLRLRPHARGGARLVVLTRWNCDQDALRKLRVQLRLQGANSSDKAPIATDTTIFPG